MNTVHQLRLAGYKVRIEHRRRYFDPVNKRYVFLTKYERSISALPDYVTMLATGGYTTVTVTNPGKITTQGVSKCNKQDLYEKRVGVYIALNEALGKPKHKLEQLEFPFVYSPNDDGGEGCDCSTVCPACKCH